MAKEPASIQAPGGGTGGKPASITIKTCPAGNTFYEASVKEARFIVMIPPSDSLEDILHPEYWSHHAMRVPPLAIMTCIDEHRRWEADLRVLQKGATFLKVVLLRHVEYSFAVRGAEDVSKLKAGYRIESRGANGWRVMDPLGKEVIAGLTTEVDAQKYLDMHIESMTGSKAA